MAGEFGGRADKFGNDFERGWVVSLALRVLHGEYRTLRWEPLVPLGRGIDVQAERIDGGREAHQCKWRSGIGVWTIPRLGAEGVLSSIKEQIEQLGAIAFPLVSRDSADDLDELARRARGCNNEPAAFRSALHTNRKLDRAFRQLCEAWSLDSESASGAAVAMRTLSREETATGYDGAEGRVLDHLAARSAVGPGRTVVSVLGRFLSDKLGNDVHGDELRGVLRDTWRPPRRSSGAPSSWIPTTRPRITGTRTASLCSDGPMSRWPRASARSSWNR